MSYILSILKIAFIVLLILCLLSVGFTPQQGDVIKAPYSFSGLLNLLSTFPDLYQYGFVSDGVNAMREGQRAVQYCIDEWTNILDRVKIDFLRELVGVASYPFYIVLLAVKVMFLLLESAVYLVGFFWWDEQVIIWLFRAVGAYIF